MFDFVLQWAAGFPGFAGMEVLADTLPWRAGCVGLFSKGLSVKERREDVLGCVTCRRRLTVTAAVCLSKTPGVSAPENAALMEAFALWAEENAPALGRNQRFTAQHGQLKAADELGLARYETELSWEFDDSDALPRRQVAHYLLVEGAYVPLGEGLEAFSPQLNALVEKSRNTLGQTQVHILGYEKTAGVETFFCRPGEPLFGMLQKILDGELSLDALGTELVQARLYDADAETAPAVRERVYIEILSCGGDAEGYQIPFRLHYTGIRRAGRFHMDSGTFTEEA